MCVFVLLLIYSCSFESTTSRTTTSAKVFEFDFWLCGWAKPPNRCIENRYIPTHDYSGQTTTHSPLPRCVRVCVSVCALPNVCYNNHDCVIGRGLV